MKNRVIIFLFFISIGLFAQSGQKTARTEYIDSYKELAMAEMEQHGIPASITLAQGILESADGKSRLAKKGNNHFGIKCHGWDGKTMSHDDDARGECFRKYNSVEESYQDHSIFLTSKQRYAGLFTIKPDDYNAWARGLKKAGYATSPTYPKDLVRIIEEFELYKYDQQVIAKTGGVPNKERALVLNPSPVKQSNKPLNSNKNKRSIFYNNRVKYIIARQGETFSRISNEMDLLNWQLPKYNDMKEEVVFEEGEKIYLQPKRNKGDAGKEYHIVKEGETLHSISQLYAVKLDKLEFRNQLSANDSLKPGEKIFLRGKKNNNSINSSNFRIEVRNNETQEDEFQIHFD